jgi:hypothetical protein
MRESGDNDDTLKKVGIGLAVVAIGAAAYYGSKGSGGGGYAPAQAADYDWDWDQFYNANYQLVWACRGVQTGQFSDESHCTYKAKIDSRWPAK